MHATSVVLLIQNNTNQRHLKRNEIRRSRNDGDNDDGQEGRRGRWQQQDSHLPFQWPANDNDNDNANFPKDHTAFSFSVVDDDVDDGDGSNIGEYDNHSYWHLF